MASIQPRTSLVKFARSLCTNRSGGGAAEVGPAMQGRGCKPVCDAAPVDCKFSEWSKWGTCSEPCGTGQTTRNRTVVGHKNCGSPCDGYTQETKACNTHICEAGIDCEYSLWSDWGACSATCGNGQTVRKRNITRLNTEEGTGCTGDLEETKGCEDICCDGTTSVDC